MLACGAMLPRLASADAVRAQVAVRVVYQFDLGLDQALRGLRSIGNHLAADPKARITVVALGAGVDFLLQDAQTPGGYPFALMVSELQDRGVRFAACRNTLESRRLDARDMIEGIDIVPSGVAEIARLQIEEQHAYIKP
ncbi:DsrE family protein [Sinimarinibacterium thermocellulolyticum]|uniref:DsrE family protein n=1 Tax=Sinimarinibacterium thermocellulolyticum TaxID=3170016 RepID=A0ABV2ACZ7_9GAMM